MKINLSGGGGKSKFAPKILTEGTQEARIARVIDLGVQPPMNTQYGTDPKRQLLVQFELADDKVEFDGEMKPAFIGMRINFVGGEKAKLTKLIRDAGIKGDNVELSDLLGKALSVTIKNRESGGNTYSNVVSFAPVSDRVAKTVPELDAISYLFDFDNPDAEILGKMGKGMKGIFAKAINYPGSKVEELIDKLDVDKKQTTESTEKLDVI